ncbi:MAG: CrcB family protein [Halobacteriaceae archaeon]
MFRIRTHPVAFLEVATLVAVGGFAGSNLRFFVGGLLPGLPGTLLVNAAGSLALGFVMYESLLSGRLARETQFVVASGFLSSLTTYSTFAVQSATAGVPLLFANVAANYACGFGAVLVGRALARRAAEWEAVE